MSKNHFWKFCIAFMLTALIAGVGLVPNVAADTGSAITVDCTVDTTTEWQTDEAMGGGLYITWDADNFYVGIDKGPIGNNTIYIDTATNGATTASFGGSFQIAAAGGYEYSFTNDSSNPIIQRWDGMNWTTTMAPATTNCLATTGPGSDVEWAIPWDNIGVASDTSRVTILVISQNPMDDSILVYWPLVTGNTGEPSPSFSQGYVFPYPAGTNASGYSPNSGTTAISLADLSSSSPINPNAAMIISLLLLLAVISLSMIYRRHKRLS